MTEQSPEIIDYRGQNYYLFQAPLSVYIEKNPNLDFASEYTTAHWRGYQGYWKLEGDKLYLTKIENDYEKNWISIGSICYHSVFYRM